MQLRHSIACATAIVTIAAAPAFAQGQPNQWLASGFAGTDFGRSAQDGSADYGGTVGYLWGGKIGADFAVSMTPRFAFNPVAATVISGSPMVNTYMGHVVGALPLGEKQQWQPFVSVGAGGIQMRPDVFNVASSPQFGTTQVAETRFGGDAGIGVMGFKGRWGFKADVRYFRATGAYNTGGGTTAAPPAPTSPSTSAPSPATPAPGPSPAPAPGPSPAPAPGPGPYSVKAAAAAVGSPIPSGTPTVDPGSVVHTALTGLAFWRTNVGLAFRF
jgi:hypothetical protein